MASNVVVMDFSLNRATIKVNPGTYMSEVVSEACRKLGKKSTNYDLKRSNDKPVDLSQTFRQTGLTPGAKLSLVEASRSPAPVSIALQVPPELVASVPGGRLTDKFPSNTTLWLMLRKFETSNSSGANLNFTARGVAQMQSGASGTGRMYYEMPVLNIMGRDLATFADLQKTLASVGFNKGNGMMRLSFRQTEQPIEEAMKVIGEYFKEDEKESEPEVKAASTEMKVDPLTEAVSKLQNPEQENEDTDMESATPSDPTPYSSTTPIGVSSSSPAPQSESQSQPPVSTSESAPILGPDGEPVVIFSAPNNSTPRAALQPTNEEDYIPSIRHAKLAQSRLAQGIQNQKLLSYDEEQALLDARASKRTQIKDVSLRIRFPDQMVVSKSITSNSTAAGLYTFVRGLIVAEKEPFKLIWMNKGPETVPDAEGKLLIKDCGIVGPTIVNLHWEDGVSDSVRKQPVLKEMYRAKATEQPIPVVQAEVTTDEVEVPKEASKDEGQGGEKKRKGLAGMIMKNLKKK